MVASFMIDAAVGWFVAAIACVILTFENVGDHQWGSVIFTGACAVMFLVVGILYWQSKPVCDHTIKRRPL